MSKQQNVADGVPQQTIPPESGANFSLVKAMMVGAAGNVAGVAVGQPFDLVKTYMQMHQLSTEQAIRQMWAHGGISSFYTASSLKLVDRACKGNYRTLLMYADQWLPQQFHGGNTALSTLGLTLFQSSLDATVSTPFDKIKMRLMEQKMAGEKKTSWQALKTAVFPEGKDALGKSVSNNLMRGWTVTVMKGTGGWLVYNTVWNTAKTIHEKTAQPGEKMSSSYLISAAFIGATAKVMATNPVDVVRTHMQLDSTPKGADGKSLGIWDTGKYVLQRYGIREFGRAAPTRWLHAALNLGWGLLVKNWFTPPSNHDSRAPVQPVKEEPKAQSDAKQKSEAVGMTDVSPSHIKQMEEPDRVATARWSKRIEAEASEKRGRAGGMS